MKIIIEVSSLDELKKEFAEVLYPLIITNKELPELPPNMNLDGRHRIGRKNRRWSEWELQVLKGHYQTHTSKAISKMLPGRSALTIGNKLTQMYRLGWSKKK